MPIILTMPALSATMEEGTLASWLVAEGDQIKAGDIIAEIETDKATMEFEAPETGVLVKILVPAGSENVAVNTEIAVLAARGEEVAEVIIPEPDSAVSKVTKPPEPSPASLAVTAPKPVAESDRARVLASPLARRIAKLHDLDISGIIGSGPNGRVVRADIEATIASNRKQKAAHSAPAISTPTVAKAVADIASIYREGSYEVVELDGMRRTIARRLTESKQTVPHFYLRVDVELDALLALRGQLNKAAPVGSAEETAVPSYKISVNDMVIKALACALRDVPDANVTWADGNMLRHKAVDVSVAVAIDGGLITPIIRDAETKSLSTISNQMKDLAVRARARKLAPEEYQGGTTSVSNLGMFGVQSFDAVINPPQGTILAVGAGEKRPVVQNDEIGIATVMTVTLSVDHRTVDGALGAELLAAFKHYIENPLALVA